ncbi:MAG: tetratricopeptide repeat protein, partial [Thermoplasmata archaeon]
DRAIRYFDEALQAFPHNIQILNNKARALSKIGRRSEALRVLDSILETHPGDARTIETKALTLYEMDRKEEALTTLETALATDYMNVRLWKVKADILERMNMLHESMESYQRALDYSQEDPSLWRAAGLLYSRMGKMREAEASYTRALRLSPEDESLWLMKAFVLEQLNEYEDAIACYDKAIGIDGRDKIPWNSKGLVLMKQRKYEKALRCFDRALELDPNFSPAREGKAMAEEEIKKTLIEGYAKQILEFEYEHNRAMTREEAFKDLKISSQHLDDVFSYLSSREAIELSQLTPQEMAEYERRSSEVLRRCVGTGGEYGLRLCDIIHNFPGYTIEDAKKVLSYVEKVSALAMKPEPSPELDDLVRKAMDLPEEKRTILGLIRGLNIGVYKARKVLANMVIFKREGYEPQKIMMEPIMGADYHPEIRLPPTKPKVKEPKRKPKVKTGLEDKKCRNHGAQAVMQHRCGQYLCNACVKGEVNCPICGLPLREEKTVPRPTLETEDEGKDFTRL